MRFTVFLLSTILVASSLASSTSVYRSLNISRLLQEKLKPQGSRGEKGPTTLPDYTGKAPPAVKDDWSAARENFYKMETARLDAQKKFHTSEFQRYVLQEELNTKRQAITEDNSKPIKTRIDGVNALQTDYQIKISEEDTIINTNQNARNPANQRAAQAGTQFWAAFEKSQAARGEVLKGYKATPISVGKGKIRRAQAVVKSYTAEQKSCIDRLQAAWKKQFAALEHSYSLNKKFHTVEFVEFELDGNKLEDMKAIWDDQSLSHWERQHVWNAVNGQYMKLRKEAATVINSANGARGQAQKDSQAGDKEVRKVLGDRKCGWFKWATLNA